MTSDFNPDSITLVAAHLIDGKRVELGEALAVFRPSDGAETAPLPMADETIIDRAVTSAHRAFTESGWRQAAPLERAEVLKRWADLIDRDRERIGRIESVSSTRPIEDVLGRDLVRATGALRYFAEWADKVEGQLLAGKAGTTSMARPEPYGVVASIAPFNFPAINAIWKSAPALAVGNAVVLKPSEMTPYSALAIAELAIEAGLPEGLFNIVQGAGITGSLLVRHPLVRMITFTGSSATGAKVMADAAMTGTKPLTLELGGKSPQLVMKDVRDLDAVATNIANGFLANSGQVCTAGTRLITPVGMRDELLEKVIAIAAGRRAGPTWQNGNTLPPIVSEKQARRIDSMLAETLSDGAEVVTGGGRVAAQNAGAYYQPTILRNVPETSVGFREEFFGPVLSVFEYEDEEEGIAMTNHPSYALAASIYTDDLHKAMTLPDCIEAGTVWVNAHGRQPDYSTPQGGFNGSGFGKEMGRNGLESFLRFKTVFLNHGE
ncbi:aldehyde dehydrogenase family protein [Hoeflea sp. YIM 152468]|uniref:aldehyde dehydrogenase family protein n=1 Tax=Hoeflea sp. YIM 152468 TaxID=3031759 RepID=UPI0023DB6382|nr:aldehyde dehydrogenase family protein [Hoeflea sp. YIM 152468]MDF1607708.1 aldehyde dehydrogenase family protein [Hoeflea sp. YIM 152468]